MHISIKLGATWWDEAPKAKISIDDVDLWQGTVEHDMKQDFRIVTHNHTESVLSIEMYNKQVHQTVCEGDTIIRDQLLKIEQIMINDIDLDYLLFSKSEYWPQYPKHVIAEFAARNETLPCCLQKVTTLGFNGIWQLRFTHPFEIWYLENLP
jgi:hypothetical protein